MNYHICILSDQYDHEGIRHSGEKIFYSLMQKGIWGLHSRTATRANIKPGDNLVFYLGGKYQIFLGMSKAISEAYFDKENSKDIFLDPETFKVNLSNIVIWEKPKPIRPLLRKLTFIKNVETWGPYLQGGIRKITEADFNVITQSEDYNTETESEKSLTDTLLTFNPESALYNPHSLSSPERIKISRIIENVQKGWKIPNFQRYFDWNKEDIRSFLESIFNDYYVGAFLMWEATEEPNLVIEPIKGVEKNSSRVDLIILDGQQRMTALYYAIKIPNFALKGGGRKNSYFYIDLKSFIEDGNREDVVVTSDVKLSRIESYSELLFPFYELENLRDWIDGFEDYLEIQTSEDVLKENQIKSIRRTIEKRLFHIWEGFEIPYVILPSTMDLSHVASVFENINSKGKPLNTFDLLIARLLKYGIKLKDLWDKACEDYPNIKRYDEFTDKTRMSVFQTMSLLYHPASSTKRKDLLNIYESLSISNISQFNELWNKSVQGLDMAISHLENMRDGFGLRSEKDIPFIPALSMVSALLIKAKEYEDHHDINLKIHQWYWSSCLISAYSSSAESQMASDYKEVTLWFKQDDSIPNVVIKARNSLRNTNFIDVNEQSSALYKSILSIIALKGAKDFVTGQNLEHARENQKDHLFPKSISIGFGKNKNIDSVLNMTWMSGKTNMFIKRGKKPSDYISSFIKNNYKNQESSFQTVLNSHYIDSTCLQFMKDDKLDEFLSSRQILLKRIYRDKIGGGSEVESKIEDDPDYVLNELEERIRILIDKKISEIRSDYWDSLIPQGVRERVKEKINYHLSKYPSESVKMLSNYDKLCFCDISDYHEIITSKANWLQFESIFGKKSETDKHFGNLKEYRNCIKHSRPMNNIIRKQGEASLEWVYSIVV